MRDVNETLAELFQKRAKRDNDGVFHYLLQERNAALVVDTTPIEQWTPELLENTLIVDIVDENTLIAEDVDGERNEISLVWVSNGTYRASVGPFPVDTLLYKEDEDERELLVVGSDIVARIDLLPFPLEFHVFRRDYFYHKIYEEQVYRVLSSKKPPLM